MSRPPARKRRISMKQAETLIAAHNAAHKDHVRLYAAYGLYKVIRIRPEGGSDDVGARGLCETPRLALIDAGISLV